MKKKPFKFSVDIYRRKVIAYLGYSYDEMQQAIKKEFGVFLEGIEKDTHRGAVYNLVNKPKGINCLLFWCEFPQDWNNFAHEVFHLTATIMQNAEVKFSDDSEEAWAYLYGRIFEQLLDAK